MKILFQGGWKSERDPIEYKTVIINYCRSLARHIVENGHSIVLTSNRDIDKLIADEVTNIANKCKKNVKDHLIYLLPEREKDLPGNGRVIRFNEGNWWIEERTFFIQNTDALIAIGGGRGTFDCLEKAFLSHKPVFVAGAIPCKATDAWRNYSRGYKYLVDGDAEIFNDVNVTPDEFFTEVFRIINKLFESVHPRRIFIVHGHDYNARSSLVDILKKIDFEPVVLEEEASKSQTIIEKLEREVNKIGFAFILYTPDDFGRAKNGTDQPRARQNVIFEHGLLIGLLGRERTCAIMHGEIEIPSDIHGMVYEKISDFQTEGMKIAKVLKQAGYQVKDV